MIVCLAPMEGITGYNLRQAINRYFGEGIDRYYSPFVTPHVKRPMTNRELEDVNPANNTGFTLVPQIMTNENEGFDRLLEVLTSFGYNEVNINLGCPSRTVTARGRGSGFLRYPDELNDFLNKAFETNKDLKLSVKTRVGYDSQEIWPELLDIYNSYPITELIVHPRIGTEAYNGVPRMDAFTYALKNSKAPVMYNGDIYTKDDYENLLKT